MPMSNTSLGDEGNRQRFQIAVGDQTAIVEVISAKNKIYAVELPGAEPVFITQIRNADNRLTWVSIPQGHEQLSQEAGARIDERRGLDQS